MSSDRDEKDSKFYFSQACNFSSKDRLDEAIVSLKKSIKLAKKGISILFSDSARDPNNSMLYNILGQFYFKNYDFDDGVEAFQKAMQIEPSLEEYHRTTMIERLSNYGMYDYAIDEIEQLLKNRPISGYYLLQLGKLHLDLEIDGNHEEKDGEHEQKAVEYFEKGFSENTDIDHLKDNLILYIIDRIRERYPKNPVLWNNVINQAINLYTQIDSKQPAGQVKKILGLFYLTKGESEKAIYNFSEAIGLFIKNDEELYSDDHTYLAEALTSCNCDFSDWAIREYQNALKLNGKLNKARYSLIRLLQKQHLNDEALNVCIEGLNISPHDTKLQFLFGIELVKKGNIKESMDIFENQVIKNLYPPVDLYEEWIGILLKGGYLAEAEKVATGAVSCASISEFTDELIGPVYIQQGKFDEAIAFYQHQVGLVPENILYRLFFKLGEMYLGKNQNKDAEFYFKHAVELNPKHYDSHKRLADIFSSKGDVKAALAEYQIIMNLDPKTIEIYDEFKKLKIKEAENQAERIAWEVLKNELPKKLDKFEKDFREFIDAVLIKKLGRNYWEKLQFDKKKQIEKTIDIDLSLKPFLEKDEIDPLDCSNINHFYWLITSQWTIFKEIFRSEEEVNIHLKQISHLRNDIKHNKKTYDPTIKIGDGSIDWFNLIMNKHRQKYS